MLADLATPGAKISVRSGHGVGKTALLAWSVLWYLVTHFPTRIPCTAPSAAQLSDVLWAELAVWLRRMNPDLAKLFELKSDRIELVGARGESFAVARTARKEQPEALQGFHSENLLFIVDEASGVPDEVFRVAQGALTSPGSRVILTGNPTRLGGFFHATHTTMRHRWQTHVVPCWESSQVSQEYVEDLAHQYGKDSNVFRVRAAGEFPSENEDTILSLELVESAIDRPIENWDGGRKIWGLDVARFGGDSCALAKRQGRVLIEPVKTWQKSDLMATAGRVAAEYEETRGALRPDVIVVDSIGMGGGVADRLRELGLPVRDGNVAEASSSKDKYNRLRDQLWFEAQQWFESRAVQIPRDDRLIGELTTPRYKFTSNGKLQVESKAEMKARGVRSPDVADAFCLTFKETDRLQNPNFWKPLDYGDQRWIV